MLNVWTKACLKAEVFKLLHRGLLIVLLKKEIIACRYKTRSHRKDGQMDRHRVNQEKGLKKYNAMYKHRGENEI